MHIQPLPNTNVSIITSDQSLIKTEQDILDLIGETEFRDLILHDHNFAPNFFDLSTKLLGNVLQKLTNYRVRLAIVGDFNQYPSKVLKDFISETNSQQSYIFVDSLETVKKTWKI